MSEQRFFLELTFRDNWGNYRPVRWCMPLGDDAREYDLKPPSNYLPGELSFEQVVTVMKRREIRRDIFEAVAAQLGRALAEHLEDREGWHGEHRKELMAER